MINIPKLPIAEYIDKAVDYITLHFSMVTRLISNTLNAFIDYTLNTLLQIPPIIFIIILSLLIWRYCTKGLAIFAALSLLLIWNLRLWDATLSTLTLVLIAGLIAVLIGIPIGIIAGVNNRARKIIIPILDFMQTMPAFVYLIPAIPFFGLGAVSGIFATLMFSMPPVIRLTALGITKVPTELIEVADAFGATGMQKLWRVQLPLSLHSMMAGVNQTIMLGLSMVVIAAMIGAGGLGAEVWKAIQRLEPGLGFEAGLAVVIIAIIIDRVSIHVVKRVDVSIKHE